MTSASSSASAGARSWTLGAVVLLAALASVGFSFVALVDTGLSGSGEGHTTSKLVAAVSIALLLATLASLLARRKSWLLSSALTLVPLLLVHALRGQAWPAILGPLVAALGTLAAVLRLRGEPARSGRQSGGN